MSEKKRCCWAENVDDIYVRYHDEEWGRPVYDDHKLFEMLVLESFQAGLSWITILKKRENFRRAFDNFDVDMIMHYDEAKVASLMQDKGIIRNQLKILAAISNAKIFRSLQEEYGSFHEYLWQYTNHQIIIRQSEDMPTHTALSDQIAADLKARGMKFFGTVIVYSYLQAVGVVNDHEPKCFLSPQRVA